MYLVLWATILLLNCSVLQAATSILEGRLLFKSSSERTLAIGIGELEDLKEGDRGKIFIQRGDFNRPTLFLVGTGKVVKSYPNKSIWLLEKHFIKDKAVKDEPLLVLVDFKVLEGRKSLFKQKHTVFSADEYLDKDEFQKNNEHNVPQKFIANNRNYDRGEDVFDDKKIEEIDREFETYSNFKKNGNSRVVDEYQEEIKRVTFFVNNKFNIGDLNKAEDQKILDSDAALLIEKYNSQKFTLTNGLYRKQKKLGNAKDVNEEITISNSYQLQKIKDKETEVIDPKVAAKISREGEMWSADMDEDTLRRYFITSGLLKERFRREIALNELDGHEILLHYAGNLNTHVALSEVDPAYQMRGYNLSLSYDYHLSRSSIDFKNYSVQFMLERGVAYYDLSNINGRSEEGQYGLSLNYYFYNNPLTIDNFIWSIGLGAKVGMAKVGADSLSQRYDYQILTLPSLQLMTKYRFRAGDLTEDTVNVGMSFNLGMIYEAKNLKIVNVPEEEIATSINAQDIKYQFGMSFYF